LVVVGRSAARSEVAQNRNFADIESRELLGVFPRVVIFGEASIDRA